MKKMMKIFPIAALMLKFSLASATSEAEFKAEFKKALDEQNYQRASLILDRMGQSGYHRSLPALQDQFFKEMESKLKPQIRPIPFVPTPPSEPFVAPPAPPAPPMPGEQPRPEGQFKWVQDEQGNWKKVPATQEQRGQIPTPPPAPEAPLYTPSQPVGDVYTHVKAILAKSSLGLVDRRTLEMELENPNLPNDLRQAINAKLGNVPTPPPAPPAPPAPPMPGTQAKPAGAFKWVQDEQGNWQRVPATEGGQKPAEDEDLGLRGLFGE